MGEIARRPMRNFSHESSARPPTPSAPQCRGTGRGARHWRSTLAACLVLGSSALGQLQLRRRQRRDHHRQGRRPEGRPRPVGRRPRRRAGQPGRVQGQGRRGQHLGLVVRALPRRGAQPGRRSPAADAAKGVQFLGINTRDLTASNAVRLRQALRHHLPEPVRPDGQADPALPQGQPQPAEPARHPRHRPAGPDRGPRAQGAQRGRAAPDRRPDRRGEVTWRAPR